MVKTKDIDTYELYYNWQIRLEWEYFLYEQYISQGLGEGLLHPPKI